MSLVFFTVWHSIKILRLLFNSVHESLSGLESRDVVGWNSDGNILGNISTSLFSTGLDDEAAETSQVNILTFCH